MKSVRLVAIAAVAALVLLGCSEQDPTKGKPFGNTESLYLAPSNIEEFIEIAQDATVQIICETADEEVWGGGSGFHIEIGEDRYIITNAHVIEECIADDTYLYVYDSDDNPHVVKVVSYRHVRDWRGEWDVAVLTGRGFGRAITISPEDPKPGHWVLGVGWPSMNGHWYQQVSMGNILGNSPDGVIINSAVSAPGMSGGPLLNSRGELVGIHFASSWDETRRALSQPVANLCQVAFVCGGERKPTFPLEFPENPIQTFIEDED